MSKRKFQIDQLIINSPYEEPSTYWSYDREVCMFERKGGQRPVGNGGCDLPTGLGTPTKISYGPTAWSHVIPHSFPSRASNSHM